MSPNVSAKNSRTIFLEAVENHPADGWPVFLDGACAGDQDLRHQVQRLLDAHGRLDHFMEQPAAPWPTIDFPPAVPVGDHIGRYKLLEQIGEGGMGVVYVAEQTEPVKRRVALKIIKPGMDSRQVIARFEAERQALALMDHQNIAKVFEAGTTDSGRPYFVMELVRGLPVTEYCDRVRLAPRQRLELFVTVCQAVQHAHQKGIIHRDLKPGNVLVTLHDGQPVVKVIDFGVAKALHQQLTDQTIYTQFAQMIGTPLYMSPEQAELSGLDVDTRSDVYSLGVLLYELLTGHTPFDGQTLKNAGFDEMRRIIREDEPPRPSARVSTLGAPLISTVSERRGLDQRRLSQHLRGELDWIVMKALEKDRNRRYESASALAADIQRFLDDLPILARPASWRLKASKWRRRHPVAAITIGAGVLLVLCVAAGAMWHDRQLSQSLAVAEGLRNAGLVREDALLQQQYVNDIRLTSQATSAGNLAAARKLLDRHNPVPGQPDHVGFEWHYLRDRAQSPVRTMTGHRDPLLAADVSPDDRYVASGDHGGEVRICDLLSGRLVKSLRYSDQEVTSVRFSPSGQLLATAGVDRIVHLWKVDDWQEVAALLRHEMTICSVAWSPDSRWLASAGRDQAVHIWDAAGHRLQRTLVHTDVVRAVAWSPDGDTLAAADGEHGVRLWKTATWQQRGLLDCDGDRILCLAFSPDNRVVATGGYGGVVRLFDVETQAQVLQVAIPKAEVWSLLFCDATRLLVGMDEGFQVWHFDRHGMQASVTREPTRGRGTVRSFGSARGREILVTATQEDRAVAVWDATSLWKFRATVGEWPEVVLPRRGLLLTPADQHTISVRRIAGGEEVARLACEPAAYFLPEVSPDEALVAVPHSGKQIGVWNAATWKLVRLLDPLPHKISSDVQFSPDSRWLASGVEGGGAGVWNLATGQRRELFRCESPQSGMVAWSPDGSQLACSVWSHRDVEVWDVVRNRRISQFQVASPAKDLCFLNGKAVAVAEHDAVISLWDPTTGVRLEALSGHTSRVDSLALSADGRTLASSSFDGTVRLWNVHFRRELFTLSQHLPHPKQRAQRLTFLPNGSLFYTTIPGQERWIFPGSNSSPTAAARP